MPWRIDWSAVRPLNDKTQLRYTVYFLHSCLTKVSAECKFVLYFCTSGKVQAHCCISHCGTHNCEQRNAKCSIWNNYVLVCPGIIAFHLIFSFGCFLVSCLHLHLMSMETKRKEMNVSSILKTCGSGADDDLWLSTKANLLCGLFLCYLTGWTRPFCILKACLTLQASDCSTKKV